MGFEPELFSGRPCDCAGGVGKTRVAIELAHAVGRRWRDGGVFVSLAPLASSEHVASAIARELDVTPAASESLPDALARHLARQELLLILDNFEHVLEAAPLVADLLARAPGVTVLATSREPLRLRAERVFQLDPLAVTPEDGTLEPAPAVVLFSDAVQARNPAFRLGEGTLPAVVEVGATLRGDTARSRPRCSGVTRCSTRTSRMPSTRLRCSREGSHSTLQRLSPGRRSGSSRVWSTRTWWLQRRCGMGRTVW